MSTQITIRLEDDLVAYIDEQARTCHGVSRAAIVARALRRDRDAAIAAAIVAGYAAIPDGDDKDLDEFLSAAEQSVWGDE